MAATENKEFSQDVDKLIKNQQKHLPSGLELMKNQMCFVLDQFELLQMSVMKWCNWWGRAEGELFQPLYTRWKAALSKLWVLVRQIRCQKYSSIKDSAVSCSGVAQMWSPECELQHVLETMVIGNTALLGPCPSDYLPTPPFATHTGCSTLLQDIYFESTVLGSAAEGLARQPCPHLSLSGTTMVEKHRIKHNFTITKQWQFKKENH